MIACTVEWPVSSRVSDLPISAISDEAASTLEAANWYECVVSALPSWHHAAKINIGELMLIFILLQPN
ncbi:hypothetical protein OGAPHI_002554 [Ogataea philodendri]|uniref:Uncharacterized protein n=1 Tax=Ogataea philodendri TaxID=1378263 RepID=A0A9P8PC76_9ASCO|nr:uncharacterized protein OGAPHI_002554 [Ogataea philodendri]KAH3668799.1 hypothetical protein OGAPHI_002554 [Ogataea philodendri]